MVKKTEGQIVRRSFADDVLTMLFSRFVTQVVGFITGIIVARTLGVEGRGVIVAALFAPQLILTLCSSGVGAAAAFHMGRETRSTSEIIPTLITLALLASVTAMAISLLWILSTWEEQYTVALVAAAVLIIPGTVIYNYVAGIFLGYGRVPVYAITSWGPALGKLAFTLIFVVCLSLGPEGAIGAIMASASLVAGILLYRLARDHSISVGWDIRVVKELLGAGLSFTTVLFMMTFLYRANIFLLQRYGSIQELGIYSIGSLLAELLWQAPTVLSALIFARSAAAENKTEFSEKVSTLARLTLLLGVTVGLIVAIVIEPFILLVYGNEFARSAEIVRALLPGTVSIMVFKILRQDLSGKGRPWVALWVIIPMIIATFVAGRMVIPVHGGLGAAYSLSIIYVVGTVVFMFVYAGAVGVSVWDIVRFRRSDFVQLYAAVMAKLAKAKNR